jgi:hypothetical protein
LITELLQFRAARIFLLQKTKTDFLEDQIKPFLKFLLNDKKNQGKIELFSSPRVIGGF